jgi:hypothetical protein
VFEGTPADLVAARSAPTGDTDTESAKKVVMRIRQTVSF